MECDAVLHEAMKQPAAAVPARGALSLRAWLRRANLPREREIWNVELLPVSLNAVLQCHQETVHLFAEPRAPFHLLQPRAPPPGIRAQPVDLIERRQVFSKGIQGEAEHWSPARVVLLEHSVLPEALDKVDLLVPYVYCS